MAIDGAEHPGLELQEGSLVMSPIAVLPMHLTDDFGYVEDGEVTRVCAVDGAFTARLRCDELAR